MQLGKTLIRLHTLCHLISVFPVCTCQYATRPLPPLLPTQKIILTCYQAEVLTVLGMSVAGLIINLIKSPLTYRNKHITENYFTKSFVNLTFFLATGLISRHFGIEV